MQPFAPFGMLAVTTRWLVSDGTPVLDGISYPPLAAQAALWLMAVVGAVYAPVLSGSKRSWSRQASLGLAAAALGIGCLGYLAPFKWWPRIGYCQTAGDGQFSLDLNQLFAVPWFLGAIALVAALYGRTRILCPACHRATFSFRLRWLTPNLKQHTCPECGSLCRVKHPVGWVLLGLVSWIVLLGLGYWWKGLIGMTAAACVAAAWDAWLERYATRSRHLLWTE
ncbi:MAG: hypothetical protein U1G07_01280 [Verrucomicrobiota bacterium]